MLVLELRADNFARLKTVAIRPDGAVVQITGQNGQGKTSCLNAIWTALKGRAVAPPVPIRKGAEKATIRLTLGNDAGEVEATVTRTFDMGGAKPPGTPPEAYTTEVKVELAGGKAVRVKPQALIDSWLGSITIDPLRFARADAKEQFDVLKRMVPGVDFDAMAKKRKELYDDRTDANRRCKEQRTLADKVPLPPGKVPAAEPDIAALTKEHGEAVAHNQAIESRQRARAQAQADADRLMDEAEQLRARASSLEKQAKDLQAKFAGAEALPAPVDVTGITERMLSVKKDYDLWNRARERGHHEAQAAMAGEKAESLSEQIEALDAAKVEAIANAKLPVPGLGLGDDVVLLNGLPFEQAGTAEKLRASIAIGMADDPTLRIMLVDEGSELDLKSMAIVREMAEAAQFQIWVARVDDTGKVGFVIEDGEIVS